MGERSQLQLDADYWHLTPAETAVWLGRLSRYYAGRAAMYRDRSERLWHQARRLAAVSVGCWTVVVLLKLGQAVGWLP